MFGKGNNTAGRKGSDNVMPGSLNLIGNGTVIRGDVETAGDIRIDGSIAGTLRSNARVVLGEGATIDGDIFCQNADISGTITGNIKVDEMLTMKPTARMDGDIIARHLVMEAGAIFNGNCKTSQDGTARSAGTEKRRAEEKVLEQAS